VNQHESRARASLFFNKSFRARGFDVSPPPTTAAARVNRTRPRTCPPTPARIDRPTITANADGSLLLRRVVEETRVLVVAVKKRRRKARAYVGQDGQRIAIAMKIREASSGLYPREF